MRYDFPSAPDGYETDLMLIIAPYFDKWFATWIVEQLRPNHVRFIVDDSATSEAIEQLKGVFQSKAHCDLKIALGYTSGLMHIKAYYLEYLNSKKHRLKKLVFGSANATKAAFGGKANAELIAEMNLNKGSDSKILQYFDNLINAVETNVGSVQSISISHNQNLPKLFLPSFKIKSIGPAPDFHAWLQRGLLAAKYQDPQQFMTVAVQLKKPLLPGEDERLFAAQGLLPDGQRNVVRHRYLGLPVATKDGEETGVQWKAKYCIWTHLGSWLSDECYTEKRSILVSKTKAVREAKIKTLLSNGKDPTWRNREVLKFVNKIKGVWLGLEKADVPPDEYLQGTRLGVDIPHYESIFQKKVDLDFSRASDRNFRERYINGYEFPRLPKFRIDNHSWDEFVRSWCESIVIEASKKTTQSLLTKKIADVFWPRQLSDLNPQDIVKEMISIWDGVKVGDRVFARYEDDEFYYARVKGISKDESGETIFVIRYEDDDGLDHLLLSERIMSVGAYLMNYFEENLVVY